MIICGGGLNKKFIKKRLNSFRIYVNFRKALIDKAVIGINGPDKIKVAFDDKEAIPETGPWRAGSPDLNRSCKVLAGNHVGLAFF